METIKLIVLSKDKDYSLTLAEALSGYSKNFIISVYSDSRELPATDDFDLMLLEGVGYEGDKRVIKLTDSYSESVKKLDTLTFVLYKYKDISELSADILLYYSLLTGKRSFSWTDRDSRIIVFCSGTGGAGKTTVAFATGLALRRYYSKSVLYLSMEEIESTPLYIKDNEEVGCLCEYLYYLFRKEGNRPSHEAFVMYDKYGTAAFKADSGRNRLRELSTEEMGVFLEEISNSGSYDYILIDMGECFSEQMKWVFNSCHRVVAVLAQAGEERERRFLKYLRFILADESDDRTVITHNKTVDRESLFSEETEVFIDFDEASIDKSGETIEISIDQDFGSGIKELVKMVL